MRRTIQEIRLCLIITRIRVSMSPCSLLQMRIEKGDVSWSELWFESKTQIIHHTILGARRYLIFQWSPSECTRQGKEGYVSLKTSIIDEEPQRSRAHSIIAELWEPHVCSCKGEIHTYIGGMVRLNAAILKRPMVWVVFQWRWVEALLSYLFYNCIKNVWQVNLCHMVEIFDEGGGSRSMYVIEAFLAYWSSGKKDVSSGK